MTEHIVEINTGSTFDVLLNVGVDGIDGVVYKDYWTPTEFVSASATPLLTTMGGDTTLSEDGYTLSVTNNFGGYKTDDVYTPSNTETGVYFTTTSVNDYGYFILFLNNADTLENLSGGAGASIDSSGKVILGNILSEDYTTIPSFTVSAEYCVTHSSESGLNNTVKFYEDGVLVETYTIVDIEKTFNAFALLAGASGTNSITIVDTPTYPIEGVTQLTSLVGTGLVDLSELPIEHTNVAYQARNMPKPLATPIGIIDNTNGVLFGIDGNISAIISGKPAESVLSVTSSDNVIIVDNSAPLSPVLSVKSDGVSTEYLNGSGTYSTPPDTLVSITSTNLTVNSADPENVTIDLPVTLGTMATKAAGTGPTEFRTNSQNESLFTKELTFVSTTAINGVNSIAIGTHLLHTNYTGVYTGATLELPSTSGLSVGQLCKYTTNKDIIPLCTTADSALIYTIQSASATATASLVGVRSVVFTLVNLSGTPVWLMTILEEFPTVKIRVETTDTITPTYADNGYTIVYETTVDGVVSLDIGNLSLGTTFTIVNESAYTLTLTGSFDKVSVEAVPKIYAFGTAFFTVYKTGKIAITGDIFT